MGQDRALEVGDGVGGDVLAAAVGWFGRVPKLGRMLGGAGQKGILSWLTATGG
jgi:hypothetical protein